MLYSSNNAFFIHTPYPDTHLSISFIDSQELELGKEISSTYEVEIFEILNDSATANIYNNIIYNNTANKGENDGDDLFCFNNANGNGIGSFVNLCCNDMGENSDFESGHSEDLYITLTDHYSHDGNIKDDPQLVEPQCEPQCGNYHLKPNSPCIDAGICGIKLPWFYLRIAPDTDYEGDRRCPGEVTTGCCDIGADEFIKPMPWLHLLLGE